LDKESDISLIFLLPPQSRNLMQSTEKSHNAQ